MQLVMQSASSAVKMREIVRSIFLSGARGACSKVAARRLASRRYRELHECSKIVLIAVGQSACHMAESFRGAMGHKVASTVVFADALCGEDIVGAIRVRHARGENSAEVFADAACEAFVTAGNDAIGVFLLSGGYQAMLSAPPFGIDRALSMEVEKQLVLKGASAEEIFVLRTALSNVRDEDLLRTFGQRRAIFAQLSAYSPDEAKPVKAAWLHKPCSANLDPMTILVRYGIGDLVDAAVLDRLSPSKPHSADVRFVSLTTYNDGIRAACETARRFGSVRVHDISAHSSAEGAVDRMFCLAREALSVQRPVVLLFGQNGARKRSLEIALRFAIREEQDRLGRPWAFLSGCTTGDRIFDVNIGAVVDGGSSAWMRQAGMEPRASLIGDAPRHALDVSGDLLIATERINPLNLGVLFLASC